MKKLITALSLVLLMAFSVPTVARVLGHINPISANVGELVLTNTGDITRYCELTISWPTYTNVYPVVVPPKQWRSWLFSGSWRYSFRCR